MDSPSLELGLEALFTQKDHLLSVRGSLVAVQFSFALT